MGCDMKDDLKSKDQLIAELVKARNELNTLRLEAKNKDHHLQRKEEEVKRDQERRQQVEEEMKRKREAEDAELQGVRDYAAWVVYATPAMLCSLEPDGVVRFLNPACEQISGYRADELIGQNWWKLLFPGERFEQVEMLYKKFRDGDVRDFEVALTTKSKDTRNVALYSLNRMDNNRLKEIVLVGIDVTARKRVEAQLESSEEKFRTLVGNIPSAVYRCNYDENRRITHVNNFIEKISGYSNWDLIDSRNLAFADLIVEEDKQKVMEAIKVGVESCQPYVVEYRIKHRDGSIRWVYEKGQAAFLENGAVDCLDGALFDITERKAMEKKLEETLEKVRNMSLTDELTQLYNRRGFETHAEQQIKIAERSRMGVAVVFVDLNGMKGINDEFGHKEGDNALVAAAHLLRETFRKADIIARLGGDEFAVMAVETNDTSAKVMTDRLQEKIKEYNAQGNHQFKISMSTGVATYNPNDPCTVDKLLRKADERMYEAKQRMYAEKGMNPR